MSFGLSELTALRPTRADARRNYDALIAAGRETFAELGNTAPLEEIARRAGVGIGTLYRNFPTRETLIERIYVEEVEAVTKAADEFAADEDPWRALTGWLRRFVDYVGTKRALIEGMNRDTATFKICRAELNVAGEPLLRRAQEAGQVRTDIEFDDVLRLVTGITAVGFTSDEQRDHVLGIAIDGIRSRP